MNHWEDNLKILESISNSFDKSSVQYRAMEEVAQAYLFLNLHKDLQKAFWQFRTLDNTELSEPQKQHFRDIGVKP